MSADRERDTHTLDRLQKHYQVREINFEVSSFWDEGWTWRVGDSINGFRQQGTRDTLREALEELLEVLDE